MPELPWAPPPRDASAGFYDAARIEYRLDAGKIGQPLEVVRIDGRQVNYEQVASSPLAEQSTGTLVVQYPHPAGRSGMARVTFAIDSIKGPAPVAESPNPFKSGEPAVSPIAGRHEEIHEVWSLDVPRAESDHYFEVVSKQNFYQGPAIDSGPAELTVTIDGRQVRKRWEQVPDFNALAQRVRREGQLVAYLRPGALSGAGSSPIASTVAYRQMLAQANGAHVKPADVPAGASPQKVARLPYAAK